MRKTVEPFATRVNTTRVRTRPHFGAAKFGSSILSRYNSLMKTEALAESNIHHSFRLYLQSELVRRCRQNSNYSLRAFAKSLRVENSWLSKVIRGKREISDELIERIGQRLGLSPTDVEKFKNSRQESAAQKDLSGKFMQLSQDSFEIISEWYHFAILELMKLENFRQDKKWISKRLGISPHEVLSAVERLQRINVLLVDESGCWIDNSQGFTTHNLGINFSSTAHRKLQATILEKSVVALQNIPITHRDHSSMMMATSQAKLEEAKRRIDEFRYSLSAFLEDCDQKDAVFQLSVGLFPLTETEIKTEIKSKTKESLNEKC